MNRLYLLFSLLVLVASCSAQQQKTEKGPNDLCVEFSKDRVGLNRCCSNQCGQMFAACTERHSGDFSACSQERNTCESSCRAEQAVERMEGERGQVVAPIPKPTIETAEQPDAGAEADMGPDASAGETPQ